VQDAEARLLALASDSLGEGELAEWGARWGDEWASRYSTYRDAEAALTSLLKTRRGESVRLSGAGESPAPRAAGVTGAEPPGAPPKAPGIDVAAFRSAAEAAYRPMRREG
jgi:hypothetical protein